MNTISKEKRSNFIVSVIISSILSFPITGFFHGFITAVGKGSFFSDIKGRFIIGTFEAFAAILSFGKPWGEGYKSETIKFRFLIFIVFVILTILIFKFLMRTSNKN